MSWLFSQALVEEYSAATCSDGEQSAPSSGSHTQQAYLPPDRMTAFSRPSRFGMTFRPLTADLGEAVLTWCQAVSRARTSALPAREQASTASGQACGVTWRGSLARFDPDTSSWRTAQPSLLEDWGESSVTWPRSGMTAAGQCWELPMLGRRISGTGSGLWPTPRAQEPGRTTVGYGRGLAELVEGKEQVQKWPTPIASDSRGSSGKPAPGKQMQLVDAVRYATPTARDWKSGKASKETMERNSRPLSEQIGGSLNPTWVEWLMGWPLGWTDLKPLATAKSLSAQQQHGDY